MRKAFSMTDETMPKDEARPVVAVTEGDEAVWEDIYAAALNRDHDTALEIIARHRIAAQSEAAARVTVLEKAAAHLLWQFDRKGPVMDCLEGWSALRAALQGEGAGS